MEYPVFYMNYNLNPQAVPWRDSISRAVSSSKGLNIPSAAPKICGSRSNEMVSRIVKSKHGRSDFGPFYAVGRQGLLDRRSFSGRCRIAGAQPDPTALTNWLPTSPLPARCRPHAAVGRRESRRNRLRPRLRRRPRSDHRSAALQREGCRHRDLRQAGPGSQRARRQSRAAGSR